MKSLLFFAFLSTLFQAFAQHFIGPECRFIGDKCYAFIDLVRSHSEAQRYCLQAGGSLAIVEEDDVWREIISQILKEEKNSVWLGLTVSRGSSSFNQKIDLSRNSFWSTNRFSYKRYENQCMLSESGDWKYFLTVNCANSYKFFCQFDGCAKSDITIENADYEGCKPTGYFRNQVSLEIKCWENFILRGPHTITCNNSTWTEMPTCIPSCPSPAARSNAEVWPKKKFYELREEVLYLCKSGFHMWDKSELITHIKIRCENEGVWSNPGKDCIKLVTIEIQNQPSIILQCSATNPSSVKWLKNDNLLSNNSKFQILPSGSMEIIQPSEAEKGSYFCIGKKNNETNIQNVFKLIRYESCTTSIPGTLKTTHEVNENEDMLFSCNLRSGEFWWKTDGDEILQSNDKHFILPSGSLLLKNINLNDNKVYSCNCENTTTAIHVIHVTASTETICGTNATSSIVTLWHSDDLTPFCYGTLINTQWVITSAFCLESYRRMKNPNISIHLTGSDANGKKIVKSSTIKIHPLYRSRLNTNDVALIKLKEPLKFSRNLYPSCLKNLDFSPKYQCQESTTYETSVIGWGPLDYLKEHNQLPGEEEMNLVRSEECRKTASVIPTQDLFCGQSNETLYVGDRGAPIVAYVNGKAFIIGIYSWGQRAIGLGSFDYFTDVLYHYKWIQRIIL